jgi:hypothetical protein
VKEETLIMRHRTQQRKFVAPLSATPFSHRWKTHSAFRLSVGLAACFLILSPLHGAIGQTTPKPVLIVRNVWIANEPDKTLQKADVMIVAGKLVRVDNTSPVPSDAMVLDGGGAVLTLQADGTIKLTHNAVSNSSGSASSKNEATDSANFKTGSLEVPDDPTARDARVPPPAQPTANKPAAPQQPAATQQPTANLAQEVTDPTAPLTTITFQNRYVPSLWGIDDHLNEFSVQVVLPYKLGGRAQIFRAVIPYFTDTPSPENRGIGDVALVNITMFPQKWGTFAIGPLVSLGTNKGPGVDTFAVGPAIGAITKRGKFLFGFLNQNLFSFGGDIKITQIQPIVSYTLNQKVSFAIGDAQTTIDWNKKKFVAVPLSFQVNYIAMLGKQPIRLFVNPQYSPINEFGQRKWTIGGGFALLLR